MEDIFFELIQVALGTQGCISKVPNEEEWKALFLLCHKQAISGIVFQALDGLRAYGQKPPLEVLYEWIGYAQIIETRSREVNKRCVEICQILRNEGFETCVLKGQGNAMLYPKPLLRTPGDIDVWVRPKSKIENGKLIIKEIVHYVKGENPEGRALYHHIDLGEYKGVEVEVHYRPSFMFNPRHNKRLQKWFINHTNNTEIKELPDGVGNIRVPNEEFNIIFQLSHIYNHLLHEGIGLRQILDYYYLLRNAEDKWKKESKRSIFRVGNQI